MGITRRWYLVALGSIGTIGALWMARSGDPYNSPDDDGGNGDGESGASQKDSKQDTPTVTPTERPETTETLTADGDGGSIGKQTRVEFGFGSGAIQYGIWHVDGVFEIGIAADHDFSELAVYHEVDDYGNMDDEPVWTTSSPAVGTEVPEYDGTVSIPLIPQIDDEHREFPSRIFKLIGFNPYKAKTVTVKFEIPERYSSPNLPN